MGYAVTIACLAVLALSHKRTRPGFVWILNAVLAALAGAAFAGTGFGQTVAGVFRTMFGWIGGIAGTSAGIIAGVVLLIGTLVLAYGLLDRQTSKRELAGWLLIPLVVLSAGGPVAAVWLQATNGIEAGALEFVGNLIGG